LVGAGHHLVEQVGPAHRGAEERDHDDHTRDEPLQGVGGGAAPAGRAAPEPADRTREQRPEQPEEDQGLQQREDQRERVAQDEQDLAREDGPGVADELRDTGPLDRVHALRDRRGPVPGQVGPRAHAASSRRLRPVRLRNTSSRLACWSAAERTASPPTRSASIASGSRSAPWVVEIRTETTPSAPLAVSTWPTPSARDARTRPTTSATSPGRAPGASPPVAGAPPGAGTTASVMTSSAWSRLRASGVASAMISPWSMTTTRSAMLSASSR